MTMFNYLQLLLEWIARVCASLEQYPFGALMLAIYGLLVVMFTVLCLIIKVVH
jgi:hypothetical protein